MTAAELDLITKQITVSVVPYFIDQRTDAEGVMQYLFGYHIKLTNLSEYKVQLLRRHWVITDGDGQQSEVTGDGVVGQQPVLTRGHDFEYNSGCHLTTSVGTMHGHFFMQVEDNAMIEVAIAPFRLSQPGAIH